MGTNMKVLLFLRVVFCFFALFLSRLFPEALVLWFAEKAAKITALILFLDPPTLAKEGAYLDVFSPSGVLVNSSCSGVLFFSILTASVFWILSERCRSYPALIPTFAASIALSIPLSILANALRISVAIFILNFTRGFMDERFAPALHMFAGGVVFFSFLLFITLTLNFGYVKKN